MPRSLATLKFHAIEKDPEEEALHLHAAAALIVALQNRIAAQINIGLCMLSVPRGPIKLPPLRVTRTI